MLRNFKRLYLLGFLGVFFMVSGCAHTPLNLSYQPAQRPYKKHKIKIAVVKPAYTGSKIQQNIQQMFMLSAYGDSGEAPINISLYNKYINIYSLKLANAMIADLDKIVASKGMIPYKTFDIYDEVTYRDKKNVDLILAPEFDFGPIIKNHHTWIPMIWPLNHIYWDHGSIIMAGKIRLVFYEPMSKEKIVLKDVDISSLGLDTTIPYSSKSDAEDKIINFLNKMYPQLMGRVAKVIDPDEIAESMSDIEHLKQEKE